MLIQRLIVTIRIGFDEGVDAVRVRGSYGEPDLAHGASRKPAPLQSLPRVARVTGHVDPTARASAPASPRLYEHLPSSREEDPRVTGVHDHVDAPSALVNEEDTIPGVATVGRAKNASLLLGAI